MRKTFSVSMQLWRFQHHLLLGLLLLGLAAAAMAVDEKEIQAVSPVEPKAGAEIPAVALPRKLPRVASVGDCAPRYRDGSLGTCINNEPCRGYGFKDEEGRVFCGCFVQNTSCGPEERCDLRKKFCVPDEEAGNGLNQ